jgi:thiamine-phosphate pyrophosphorylase
MRLVVFTPEATAANELRTINKLFDAGLQVLHVRKPQSSVPELRQYLNGVADCHRQRIMLHQHHHLASELGLKVVFHVSHKCTGCVPASA